LSSHFTYRKFRISFDKAAHPSNGVIAHLEAVVQESEAAGLGESTPGGEEEEEEDVVEMGDESEEEEEEEDVSAHLSRFQWSDFTLLPGRIHIGTPCTVP
jgi:hypothetical protein